MRNSKSYRADHLFVPPQVLLPFAQAHETPFYLYDEMGVRKTARTVHGAFFWNPGFCQYYAMKANAAPALLQILRQEGCGVLACTLPELLRAERCGFRPEQIVVQTCALTEEFIRQIHRIGCEIVFDALPQLHAMAACGALPQTVGLRYNPGCKVRAGAIAVANPENAKSGMNREQITNAVEFLRARGVTRIGLQAHFSSNNQDVRYLPTVAGLLFDLAADLYGKLGCKVCYCDLGGGVGLNYDPRVPLQNFPHIARLIREQYEQRMVPAGLEWVPLRTELGRYMVGRHGLLISRVVEVRERMRSYAILDASCAQLPRPMLARGYQHISVVGDRRLRGRRVYSVHGCLPDSRDCFHDRITLPRLEPGRVVALHTAGAYCQSMSGGYGLQPCCAEFLYASGGEILPAELWNEALEAPAGG